MKPLYFACNWNLGIKQYSWSGTHWAIFTHLQKYYNVKDIPTGGWQQGFPDKYYDYIDRIRKKLFGIDMDMHRMKRLDSKISRQIPDNATVFQFDECPHGEDRKRRHFIYQDLSVSYVRDMAENLPDVFAVSEFQTCPLATIRRREQYQNSFYEKAAGMLTMGHWLAEYLKKDDRFADHVYHIGGGYNIDTKMIKDIERNGRRFLFVGRNFIRKNGPLVVEAFRKLHERYPDTELYIAGPPTLNLHEDGIHVLGALPYEKMVYYFNHCDYFVMPSIFEVYGLVFPEALTFGLPCIGRDAYEMPYFIEEGKTGLLLRHQDADELCGLMVRLMEDTDIKSNVVAKREWYLKEYSWDTVAERAAKIMG